MKLDLCTQLHNLRPNRSSFSTAEWDAVLAIKLARSAARGKGRPAKENHKSRAETKPVTFKTKRKEPSTKSILGRGKAKQTKKVRFAAKTESTVENIVSKLPQPIHPDPSTCNVCVKETFPDVQLLAPVTSKCHHEHDSIYHGCLEQHIGTRSTSIPLDAFTCPYDNC
jgi:hypothetical protein